MAARPDKLPPPIPGKPKGPPPIPESPKDFLDEEGERLDAEDLIEVEDASELEADLDKAFDRIVLPEDFEEDDGIVIVEGEVEEAIPLIEIGDEDMEEIHEGPRSLDEMLEMQKKEMVVGEMEFPGGVEVAFALSRAEDPDKRKKSANQDAIIMRDGIIGALDGLGGSKAGGLASAEVSNHFPTFLSKEEQALELADEKTVEGLKNDYVESQLQMLGKDAAAEERAKLEAAWEAAPTDVRKAMISMREAIKHADKVAEKAGGQTTIDVAKTVTVGDRRFVVFGHAGDGGMTLKRMDGTVEELTKEDSLLDTLIGMGFASPDALKDLDAKAAIPAKVEAMVRKAGSLDAGSEVKNRHIRMMMTNALGGDAPVIPRTGYIEVFAGDELYLNSDGPREELTGEDGMYDPKRVAGITSPDATPLENAKAINAAAKAEGKKGDDKITGAMRFK